MLAKAYQILCLAACLVIFEACQRQKVEVKKEKIDDIELAYYIRGTGEPMILIMGFRGTMTFWDPGLLEILEKKYQLILFDNRGAGFSTDSKENFTTISQMAEDTANLIRSLGYKKTHVLGWSMGSRIAMELALKHPEIVDHLILCAANPGGSHQAMRTTDAHEKLTSKNMSKREGLSLIFPSTPEGQKASSEFVVRLKKAIVEGSIPDNLNVNEQTVERQAQALKLWDGDNDIYGSLTGIKMPTLVAGGAMDVLNNPDNIRMIADRIPFAWSAYFSGAGHDFLSQDYKNFAKLVILFIDATKNAEQSKLSY